MPRDIAKKIYQMNKSLIKLPDPKDRKMDESREILRKTTTDFKKMTSDPMGAPLKAFWNFSKKINKKSIVPKEKCSEITDF
jgi:hypothetical protein